MPGLVLVRLGLRSLMLHKLRSGLSILGVVFGVAAVVSMSSVGEGARRETLAQIEAMGIDTVTVRMRHDPELKTAGGLLPNIASNTTGELGRSEKSNERLTQRD